MMLFLLPLNYKIESNSQQKFGCVDYWLAVFATSKLQNWKQFTTDFTGSPVQAELFLLPLNYKIESNSQLNETFGYNQRAVFATSKLQNWKQFTTIATASFPLDELFLLPLNYKIESNSQLELNEYYGPKGCFCYL